MCDICSMPCEEPGCVCRIPVHIADFCTPRDTIQVRCALHPPAEDGWTVFDIAEEELYIDEEDLREPEYATVYMRYTGDPEALVQKAQDVRRKFEELYPSLEGLPMTAYGVGDVGGIYPNGEWYERDANQGGETDE